ncbi:MAG: lysophospholipid acyltransferase family protein [Candidatus Caccovivens sp.]
MIDKDGVERPDAPDENILKIKHDKRKIAFDGDYNFKPHNIFFRMWASFFRVIAITILNPYIRIKYKFTIFNSKNKDKLKGKPFIMTSNHVHIFDDVSIGTNLFCWRKIYFTTLDRNIKRPMVGFWLRSLGGIPIPAGSLSGMKRFNEDISYLLRKGKPILYNPEGSLWPYYREIRPYKRGAFSMAVKNDVPVLPLIVLFKRKPKRNGKYKYEMFHAVCNPIEIDKSLPDEKSRCEKLMKETFEVTKRIAKEWYEIQDCGFGDEKYKRKLKPNKELFLENDQWVVKEKKEKKK